MHVHTSTLINVLWPLPSLPKAPALKPELVNTITGEFCGCYYVFLAFWQLMKEKGIQIPVRHL